MQSHQAHPNVISEYQTFDSFVMHRMYVIVIDHFRGLYGIYKHESQGRTAPEGRDAYKRHTNQGNGL